MEPSENRSDSVEFKKPAFLPDKFVKPKPVPAEPISSNDAGHTVDEEPGTSPSTSDSIVGKAISETAVETVKPKTSFPPIPYTEPSWGGRPDTFYSLEEMKNGSSLRNIPLDTKSYYSFGRLECCNIVMAHPTISRYHAVLQFRSTFSNEDERKGFYLYDLGSTHGTFLNKYRIMPKTYVKIQVGHMIKFGSSTRFFLLHGPHDDQEVESQFSYTELKEKRKQELEKREADYLQERARLIGTDDDEDDSEGIDWGMGEDADEATDLRENPFALLTNEDMYKDDPKKCLKQWFEREGEELHYHIEEKGFSQFRCTIELPIDDCNIGNTTAEAVVSGRKKEAAFQCALEACRILDRAGLLRPSNQESRKRKLKNWEEDDYYDSDEDNFFDRTGDLETKRKQRMKQVQKTQPTTDTYETLVAKHEKVLQEIEEMEQKLNTMLNEARIDDDENLDSFSFQRRSGQILDKLEYKKIKTNLSALKMDEDKLRKLINFVKPFELPEIKPPPVRVIKEEPDEVIQPRIKEKAKDEVKEEKKPAEEENSNSKTDEQIPIPSKETNESSSIVEKTSSIKIKNKNSERAKKIAQSYSNQYEEDFNNIVWAPPTNQTGDGRTSLNDKFGY